MKLLAWVKEWDKRWDLMLVTILETDRAVLAGPSAPENQRRDHQVDGRSGPISMSRGNRKSLAVARVVFP